jgi:hypothetical protein
MMSLAGVSLLCMAVGGWDAVFADQPIASRPGLEVRYTDGTRTAFEIIAEAYHLTGELAKPHRLVHAENGEEWLWLSVEGADGTQYTSKEWGEPSRINLYRRGPYFCEVHWFDVRVADGAGNPAPLKGDVALYCYPDKLLASVTWHAVEDFGGGTMSAHGRVDAKAELAALKKGDKALFAFPVFGETEPLPDAALESIASVAPLRYDHVRGCYRIGSLGEGGFQGRFYHYPNRYDRVAFRVTNDGPPRTIYVCHENTGGDRGSVEGGAILDAEGHPLPVTVQISKNFAGEKEEKFYNPGDTPFSETYFPVHLGKGETVEMASLQLYQNWGRHMVKQFSSLGAWMDYFHSSTGVTETTCYVPFKFGGLPGVAIADYRAMSQTAFWSGQPQHDNVAGHSFLSYKTGDTWQYMVYRGTTYRSTGPNWMDIGFEYLSTDGAVKATVDTFELPQADELRNFLRVRYEVLKPVKIEKAKEDFRLLTIASWVQRLRYTRFAASGGYDLPLSFENDDFGVRGAPLPSENAFAAVYGERKGSNAFVVQDWTAMVGGVSVPPAASVWCQESGDTRLLLVPGADTLELKPGDAFAFDAFIMAYGEVDGAVTLQRETAAYGTERPRIVSVTEGEKLGDFPARIRARRNRAEFSIAGGRDVVPVIVTGCKDYRWPRLYRKTSTGWRRVEQGRAGDLDGVQTFCDEDGLFGAVFLVHSDEHPQVLRAAMGEEPEPLTRISIRPKPNQESESYHAALIQAPWMNAPICFRFPESIFTDALDFIDHTPAGMVPLKATRPALSQVWEESEGGALWFEWDLDKYKTGGRLSPNEDDVDLEFWLANGRDKPVSVALQFCPVLKGTMFEDPALERTWIHSNGKWVAMADTSRGDGDRAFCHYPVEGGPPIDVPLPWGVGGDVADCGVAAVTSADGRYVFAIAWPDARSLLSNAEIPCVHADPVLAECPSGRRIHRRGKLYLMEGTLDDLLERVRREVPAVSPKR